MSVGVGREVFVEVQGLRLRAVLDGSPRTGRRSVLVLHGFTGGVDSMECVSAPIAKARQVARLELVGHGGSDAPEAIAPYEMKACVEQVAAASVELGLERPHLVGYSMGGRTALATALAHPNAFGSLSLVGATAGIADEPSRQARIRADEALADRIEAQGLESFVDEWMSLPIFASQSKLGKAALDKARAERLLNRPHGLANSLRGMGAGAQMPLHDSLRRFSGPTLLVVGEQDAKFREIASSLEVAMCDARIATISGVGHAAHLEAPERFARVLHEFLDEVEAIENRGAEA